MSFKTCEADIHTVQHQVTAFQAQYTEYSSHRTDIHSVDTTTANPNVFLHQVQPVYTAATDIHNKLTAIEPVILKFVVKASETDEDKQIYGAAQTKKILDSSKIYQQCKETFEPLYSDILQQYTAINTVCSEYNARLQAKLQAEQAEQQRIAAEQAAVQAEQQRIQQERDAAAAAEQARLAAVEAQRQAEIAAERAAVERKLQRERDAKAKHDAELEQQRIAAEQERQQHLQAAADSQARQQHSLAVQQQMQQQRAAVEQVQSGVQSFTENAQLLAEHNSKDTSLSALQQLLRFINNILNNPLDATYRSIDINDTVLQSTVLITRYGEQCMQALGFALNNDKYEMAASAEQWNTLQECKRALVKQISAIKHGE